MNHCQRLVFAPSPRPWIAVVDLKAGVGGTTSRTGIQTLLRESLQLLIVIQRYILA